MHYKKAPRSDDAIPSCGNSRRAVLAVKGSRRRAKVRRALDRCGPLCTHLLRQEGMGFSGMAPTAGLKMVNASGTSAEFRTVSPMAPLLGGKIHVDEKPSPQGDHSPMSSEIKYIGLDIHKEAISIAALNGSGKLVMESIIETEAATILQFVNSLRGQLHMTFEEGTWAAWLYDLLKPHVHRLVVCNPRRNALLKEGSKSDKIDARKLAELLRGGLVRPVYHGENGLRTLRELARSYLTLSKDVTRVMNRLKALYRGWGIPCGGVEVYDPRYRAQWLKKIPEAGVRRRAEIFYEQLDGLRPVRQKARHELLIESRKHKPAKLLRQIPCIGPIRAAMLLALMQTPHRFRSKRQLWAYSGLAVNTHDSAQYRYVGGQLQRSKKPQQLRGLNQNHNHQMKELFKSTATNATRCAGPFQDFYARLLGKGMEPEMARLTLARKIAAITLTIWKKGDRFDANQLKAQAA
jgi:transposase